ncbi:MAG: S-layer homology domain-containing protein [Eubacteriales bacterium]|nr:S-layer homology domain-containing protein [Eubacteriales bacterium]
MRILKKITSLLLVMAMLCSAVTVFADEAVVTDDVVAAPVVDASYEAAVEKLSAFGFWHYGENDDGDKAVTRGEFAYLAASLVNMDDYGQATTVIFRDVDKTHPYFNSISFLHDLGVVSGEYGALYRPEEAITYAEAMKILLCVMGYEGEALDSGAYPAGFLFVANKAGVGLSGIKADDTLTRQTCAYALTNAIDVDIRGKVIYGAKFTILASSYGKTLLSEYHDIYQAKGVVNAVGSTRATLGVKLPKDVAEIDGVAFNVGTSNVKKYIGYKVAGYYEKAKDKSQKSELVYVEPVQNETIEITHDYLDKYDPQSNKIYYHKNIEGTKTSYISLNANNCNWIYNNVRSTTVTQAMVESADRIFAIDNDMDGNYDVVFVDYEMVMMVKSVDSANYKIYSNYPLIDAEGRDMGSSLDIEDDGMFKITNITDRYGNDIDISAISFGTILNVLKSDIDANGAVTTTVIVTNQSVSGAVSEVSSVGNGQSKVIIDGTEYEFAKNEAQITERADLALGSKYTFYLDLNNKLAGMGAGTSTDVYGVIIKAGYKDGFSTAPEVKMFTADGAFVLLNFAENAKINGKSLKTISSQEDVIREFFNVSSNIAIDLSRSDGIIAKAVTYRLNSEGLISRLEVAKDNTGISLADYYQLSAVDNKMIKFPLAGNPMYIRNPLIFDGKFKIASTTKVFIIPQMFATDSSPIVKPDKLDAETIRKFDNEKLFSIGNVDSFKSYAGINYKEASFYNLNQERVASLALYQQPVSDTKLSKSTGITVVKKISKVLDADGNETYKLYGLRATSDVEVMISEEESSYELSTANGNYVLARTFVTDKATNTKVVQTVEPGDMIRFVTNKEGELYDYEKIFDLSDNDDPEKLTRFTYASRRAGDLSVGEDGEYENTNDYENNQMVGMKCMLSITDKYLDDDGKGWYSMWHGSNIHYFYGVGFKFIYTKALDIIGGTLFYEVKASRNGAYGTATEEIATITGFKITIIDATDASDIKIYAGDRADIVPKSVDGVGTDMLMYLSDASPKEIFIVKK